MNKKAIKGIYFKLNESQDGLMSKSGIWNPKKKYHIEAYNSFVKWYNKQLNHLDKNELLDMLKKICNDIKNDSLNELKEGECCYNTGINTIGIGDVVPPSMAAMTGPEQASDACLGSGDRFDMGFTTNKKKSKKKKHVIYTKK